MAVAHGRHKPTMYLRLDKVTPIAHIGHYTPITFELTQSTHNRSYSQVNEYLNETLVSVNGKISCTTMSVGEQSESLGTRARYMESVRR